LNPAGDRDAVYQSVKKELAAKYGPPTSAGQHGFVRWTFPATLSRKVAEALELSLSRKYEEVNLSYLNETMAKSAPEDKDEL
jgi:hypothetical protein